jgi:hypothetical protein
VILPHRVLHCIPVSGLILLMVGALCRASTPGRSYLCYRLASEPVIDGRIADDPAWETIPGETGFLTPYIETFGMSIPPSQQTIFRLGYDSTSLYLAVECEEPWIRYLKRVEERPQEFRRDDGIEIVLSTGSADTLHHFIINALGSRWSGTEPPGAGIALEEWDARTQLGDGRYTIEAKLPFSVLGRTPRAGEVWLWNIGRNIITINCPEDRMTSWSPVHHQVDEPERFGRLVFMGEILTARQARNEEARLGAAAEEMLRAKDEALAEMARSEEGCARNYLATVKRTGKGILGVSRGKADLVSPPATPAGEIWRYGLGFPMQISPTEAALFCNIRKEGSGNIDFEIGSDLIIFDDLEDITPDNAIPVSRYETGEDSTHGATIVRKGPILGGFVPVGSVLADGSPHPHAGTGFGMCWAISHRLDAEGRFDYLDILERYAMMFQFAYDGRTFRVLEKTRVDAANLLPDWKLAGNFITNAIPDGKDLLYVMIARVGDIAVAGVTRWQRGPAGWRPVDFVPVTGTEATWSEPSLVREADGGLLFSARSGDRAIPVIAFDIAVWRSRDNGKTWSKVLHEKNRRSRSPVSVNRAVDGTPYIAANIPPLRRTREKLCFWPIDEARTGLVCRILARDAPSEFGSAPSGSWWRIDHPTSAVIRLADRRWHNVLSYRVVDNGEVEGSASPAPQTGCYVEEVFSAGAAVPAWHFGEE